MRTNIPKQKAGEPACVIAPLPRPRVVCWALTGCGVGVSSATAYLLLGGEYFWGIPPWASVVFFPGFLTGFQVNEWGLNKDASKVVGVLAVGLAYAALAILARFAWRALQHRRRAAALRQISE